MSGAVILNRDQVKQLGWRLDGYMWFDWHIWCFSQCWAMKIAVIGATGDKVLKTTKRKVPGKKPVKSPTLSFFFILAIIKCFFYFIDLYCSVRLAATGWVTVCWGNKPLVFHNSKNWLLSLLCRNFSRFFSHTKKSVAFLVDYLCWESPSQRL